MKLFLVIPAFNEEKSISKVIKGLRRKGYKNIIVVDDASRDNTYKIAKNGHVTVLRHRINRGLGGALGTGIQAALQLGADAIVTFDADGQHKVQDVSRVFKLIKQDKADFAIGSRLVNPKGMPWIRRVGNWFFNLLTYILFGVWTTDSQSGLRCFNRKAAEVIRLRTNRMEVSSEFIKEVGRNNLRYAEIPIKPVYTEYSMKKGQSHLNGIRILRKLLLRRIME